MRNLKYLLAFLPLVFVFCTTDPGPDNSVRQWHEFYTYRAVCFAPDSICPAITPFEVYSNFPVVDTVFISTFSSITVFSRLNLSNTDTLFLACPLCPIVPAPANPQPEDTV
jgi:hypothetical protein